MERLPDPVRDSFTEEHLALAASTGGSHASPSAQGPSQVETRRNCPRYRVWLD